MDLLNLMKTRHSVRVYTGQNIPEEKLTIILQAAFTSASGRAKRPWHFFIIQNRKLLKTLSTVRGNSSKMLENAGAAIITCADSEYSDTWIEDCSICMANMHLMAHSLGYGSCWIQIRGRQSFNPELTAEAFIKQLCNIPQNLSIEAILSVGEILPQSQNASSSESVTFREDFFKSKVTFI